MQQRAILGVAAGVTVLTVVVLLVSNGSATLRGGPRALVVPGGGVGADGTPPMHVSARLDAAAKLWSDEEKRGMGSQTFIVLLSAGTPHKPPPRDPKGFPVLEATAGARYLIGVRGVPPSAIREELVSLDTIGNAVMARLLILDPLGCRTATVITSAFHMPRVE